MKRLYCIRDLVSMIFDAQVIVHHNDTSAVRTFEDALRNPQGFIGQHPKDFELVCVGDFDEETGRITGFERVVRDGNGVVIGVDKPYPRVVLTGEAWLAMQSSGPAAVREA